MDADARRLRDPRVEGADQTPRQVPDPDLDMTPACARWRAGRNKADCEFLEHARCGNPKQPILPWDA